MVMQTIEYDELSMEKGRWRSEECPLTKNTLLEMSFSPKTLVRFSLFFVFLCFKGQSALLCKQLLQICVMAIC